MKGMKDSGVEWIGEIPKDWNTIKNKYVLKCIYSGGTPTATNLAFYSEQGTPFVSIGDMSNMDYVVDTKKHITKMGIENKKLKLLPPGTILYSIYATVGAVSELKVQATISQAILALVINNKFNEQYYKYNLVAMKDYIFSYVNGNTQFNLNADKVNNFIFTFPPFHVQERIAIYLDNKCSKIDAIMAREQAVIEKLKEYKLSVITEAVTKGVHTEALMKDSGVEWIGKIPRYWDISHIGNLAEIGSGGTPDRKKTEYWENGSIRWMASGEINYEYVYDTTEKITELGMQNYYQLIRLC